MLSAFNRLVNDRVSSPLFSTFTITWVLANWKIFYLTFFINSVELKPYNKVEYILLYYVHWGPILVLPIVSTAIILFAMPYVETFVYKIYVKHKADRRREKENSENDTRFSVEDSRQIVKERIAMNEE